jgi:hypothetical protein
MDFGEFSKVAIPDACDLVNAFHMELQLLHVIHDWATEIREFWTALSFPAYVVHTSQRMELLGEKAFTGLTQVLKPNWEQGG